MIPKIANGGVAQDRINSQLYGRADLVQQYASVQLHPPEAVALVRYREHIQGRQVLEVGCGAGRIATYLRPLTQNYVGLDISEHMVNYCRQKFENVSFVRGDMRSLPFEAGIFDSVFAVFNVFDAVSHEDRLRCLSEARRVLKADGLLFFSTHNRNWIGASRSPRLEFKVNPISQFRSILEYFESVGNHRRIKPNQRFERDYALLNDQGHNFAVLHYYIRREIQANQLAQARFRLIECLDELGRTLGPDDDDSANSCIHYVARSVVD